MIARERIGVALRAVRPHIQDLYPLPFKIFCDLPFHLQSRMIISYDDFHSSILSLRFDAKSPFTLLYILSPF